MKQVIATGQTGLVRRSACRAVNLRQALASKRAVSASIQQSYGVVMLVIAASPVVSVRPRCGPREDNDAGNRQMHLNLPDRRIPSLSDHVSLALARAGYTALRWKQGLERPANEQDET